MEYVNEININEAIIHVLDSNGDEPILNEYSLDLDEDIYTFLYKHIEKSLKDEELRYAKFNYERNIVREITQNYLNGTEDNLIKISQELAKQLFCIMKGNCNITSGDLIISSITTDQGPMIAILKMDYVKNFTHEVQFIDSKIGVGIIPQVAGLPSSGQKLQKAAFIRPIRENDNFNLMILDKQKSSKEDESGANYFINAFLGASIVTNERDMTKTFLQVSENWIRKSLCEDASEAEKARNIIKTKLRENDAINIDEIAEELFPNAQVEKESFTTHVKMQGLADDVAIDKLYIEKKFKRTRLNIDRRIDLYIDDDIYNDSSKFEVKRNGDGSINMIIKNVINYIEK